MRKAWIAAWTVGVLLVVGGSRAADLWWSRQETLKLADSRVSSLTVILSHYVSEAFAAGDAMLRQIAIHGARVGGPAAPASEWESLLLGGRAGLSAIGAVSVIDVAGRIRHSTRPEIVGQSRRDDPLVRQALASSGDSLLIGPPFRAVIAPHDLLIPIARRLTDAHGDLDGVVVASFLPSGMRSFFQSVDIGQHGTIWVFHPDGTVLFREPSASNALGESAGENPILRAALAAGEGTVTDRIEPDRRMLLTAFQTIQQPHLIVAVSLDRDEALLRWQHDAFWSGGLFAVAAGVLGVILLSLFRQMDERAGAERSLAAVRQREAERLRESHDRLAAAFEREQAARQHAEEASALKDEFLMTLSHELRTPLTAIAGWAQMLVDGMVDDGHKDFALRTIDRNARAQTRLVEDLLDVSRIITGKMRLDVRPVELAASVRSAVEAMRPAADAKGIAIDAMIDPDLGVVSGDPDRLQQIVWNLVSNAVKFTPANGRVSLAVRRETGAIELIVQDTGRGIAPEFLPYVFDRFRQQEAGTSRTHGGLGLGLAIVRNLVEQHGGSVTAHSDGEGRGATFIVRLPARVAVASEA